MASLSLSQQSKGAYCSLGDLVALRFAANNLTLQRRNRALSMLAGPVKSNFRGRGIDFEEVRRYQPGDDIRGIDWRVTARTGEAHTKLFREERERPVMLVVDQRNSMFFGSVRCLKSVLACHVGSLLAWSALNNNDRVGGLVFNDNGHVDTRPRRSRKTVLHLLSQLADFNHQLPQDDHNVDDSSSNSFSNMLSNLRRVARPGTSIYIISDFHGANTQLAQKHLFQLAKHNEITALYCQDPLETQLPLSGHYGVTNGKRQVHLHTGSRKLRQRYAQQHQLRLEHLTLDLQQLGIPLIELSTTEKPFTALKPYYGRQQK